MNENEPPMRCRKDEMMSKPGTVATWDKQENNLSMLLRHPAYRRHELTTGFCKERVKLSSRCQEKTSSRCTGKKESIDAWHGGRLVRSSDEVPVMGMERRSQITQLPIGGNCKQLQEVRR
jgi:hypothetical protein